MKKDTRYRTVVRTRTKEQAEQRVADEIECIRDEIAALEKDIAHLQSAPLELEFSQLEPVEPGQEGYEEAQFGTHIVWSDYAGEWTWRQIDDVKP